MATQEAIEALYRDADELLAAGPVSFADLVTDLSVRGHADAANRLMYLKQQGRLAMRVVAVENERPQLYVAGSAD